MRKAVPWNAVRIRNTKYEARFGAKAVPMLKAKNKAADMMQICDRSESDEDLGSPLTHLLP